MSNLLINFPRKKWKFSWKPQSEFESRSHRGLGLVLHQCSYEAIGFVVSAVTAVSCCRSIAEAKVPACCDLAGSVLVVFYRVHVTADARAHEERIVLANGASSERSARKRGIAFQIRSHALCRSSSKRSPSLSNKHLRPLDSSLLIRGGIPFNLQKSWLFSLAGVLASQPSQERGNHPGMKKRNVYEQHLSESAPP